MHPFVFTCFAIFGLTSAERIVTSHVKLNNSDVVLDRSTVTSTLTLVDMTRLMYKFEGAHELLTIRCCCDSFTNQVVKRLFDGNTRSGRCGIFVQEDEFKCGDMTPKWKTHDGNLHHFRRLNDPRCIVTPREAREFFEWYGSSPRYCPEVRTATGAVSATAFGNEADVKCILGYTQLVPRVTCIWKSIEFGIFDPQPECILDEKWCPTIDFPEYMNVQATQLGKSSPVNCQPGFESEHNDPTCTKHGTWEPYPACKKISNYCQFRTSQPTVDPQVLPASIYEWVPVECPAGYDPGEFPFAECIEGGVFRPLPSCNKTI